MRGNDDVPGQPGASEGIPLDAILSSFIGALDNLREILLDAAITLQSVDHADRLAITVKRIDIESAILRKHLPDRSN